MKVTNIVIIMSWGSWEKRIEYRMCRVHWAYLPTAPQLGYFLNYILYFISNILAFPAACILWFILYLIKVCCFMLKLLTYFNHCNALTHLWPLEFFFIFCSVHYFAVEFCILESANLAQPTSLAHIYLANIWSPEAEYIYW